MNTAVSHETERLHPAADTILRLLGVALQIASTLALARTLAIGDTGLFFQGLVVTIAGATFMRAKFDLYISRHIIGRLQRETGLSDLCLGGGVALNGVANGRILRESGFSRLFVPPAPGDAGCWC